VEKRLSADTALQLGDAQQQKMGMAHLWRDKVFQSADARNNWNAAVLDACLSK
jgi:hypothetical protein